MDITYGLTQEDFEKLGRPFPAKVIKHFQGKGGKQMSYIDVDVLEDRVREVDPNFANDIVPGAKSVVVKYTIKGVTRAGIYDNDSEQNKFGGPQVNASARAARRALRLFGVGAQLWDTAEDEDDETPARPTKSASQSQSRPSGSGTGPSSKQMEWLTGKRFGVPTAVAKKLTGGRGGTASAMIDALKQYVDEEDYEENKSEYLRKALTEHRWETPEGQKKVGIDKKLAAMLDEAENGDDEDDDDDAD